MPSTGHAPRGRISVWACPRVSLDNLSQGPIIHRFLRCPHGQKPTGPRVRPVTHRCRLLSETTRRRGNGPQWINPVTGGPFAPVRGESCTRSAVGNRADGRQWCPKGRELAPPGSESAGQCPPFVLQLEPQQCRAPGGRCLRESQSKSCMPGRRNGQKSAVFFQKILFCMRKKKNARYPSLHPGATDISSHHLPRVRR
jgi:hypothetical protein